MSATSGALLQTTHQSLHPFSVLLHLLSKELCRHHHLKLLHNHDLLWIRLAHHRRLHHKETCLVTLMAETTTLIATTKPASHHLPSLVLSQFLLLQFHQENPSTSMTIVLMTCTQLHRPDSRWIAHRHRRRHDPNSRRQCLLCLLFHSQALPHVHRQGNPLM
jgi:hypothetical protein